MSPRQYLREMEKMMLRMLKQLAQSQQAEIEALSDRFAVVASSSWVKSPLAAGDLTNIAAMLRAERQRQGMSLHDIQEATGISSSALSLLENQKNKKPSIATLERIATALGMKFVVAMVKGEEPMRETQTAPDKTAEELAR